MNVGIGTEAALFPEKEYIMEIFFAVWRGVGVLKEVPPPCCSLESMQTTVHTKRTLSNCYQLILTSFVVEEGGCEMLIGFQCTYKC
jgi:hypothetical protein